MEELVSKITISESASVREAMEAVDHGAVGFALIVDIDGRLKGVVTDGDIRRAILRGSSSDGPVAAIMNREPVVAREGMGEQQLLGLMDERVRFVPILDDNGKLVDLASYEHVYRIPVAEPVLGQRELDYVTDCIKTGWVSSQGKYVMEFERRMADYCGVRHAISASNGTAALHLALLALDVGPGDEVIVPDMTFIASANTVTYTGATPVLVDVDRETWTMDIDTLAERLTDNTRAIMPVHLFGIPARMDRIMEIAEAAGVAVVEDAAEAHGATFKGRKAGSIGDLGCFSFFGNKIITTGEGGMITTDSDELAGKVRLLRDHGMSGRERYFHPVLGYNYRLTNVQAAIGVAQMEKIELILERKREISSLYKELLGGNELFTMPPEPGYGTVVYWMFAVLLSASCGKTTGQVADLLSKTNVETRPFFVPIHRQPIYEGAAGGPWPISDELYERGLCLPSSANLKDADVRRICDRLASVCE